MKAENLGQIGTILGWEKSDTSDNNYAIRWYKDKYSCECPGFMSSKKKPKSCKHITRFLFKTELEQRMIEYESRGFLNFQNEGAKDTIIEGIMSIVKGKWNV